MALEAADIEIITDTVYAVLDRVIAERMEQVYAGLEETREQMQQTVAVLEGNDHALLGEVRKLQHAGPVDLADEVVGAWERFIHGEATRLGITRPVLTKTKKMGDDDGDG